MPLSLAAAALAATARCSGRVWKAWEMKNLGRAAEVKQATKEPCRKHRLQQGRALPSWEKQEQLGQQKRKTQCMGWRKLSGTGAELTPHFLVTECLQANSSPEPAQARGSPHTLPVGWSSWGLAAEQGCWGKGGKGRSSRQKPGVEFPAEARHLRAVISCRSVDS